MGDQDKNYEQLQRQALAESEEKYRRLVETTDTGYLILDEDGRVVDANSEYVRLTGHRSLSEILGREVAQWTASHDAARSAQKVEECLERGAVRQLEIDYLGPEGELTPVEINASAIETKAGRRIIALCRDITARKRAEEALRQSHDELRAICDGMVEGLIISDIETKQIRRVNLSFCRMLGYGEEELLTKSVRDLHPAEEVPNDLQRFQAAAEGRVSINEGRPILRKDGTIFYADITGHRILFEGRSCLLALFRDITERQQVQEALARERRSLWTMLEARDHERQTISYEIHDGLAQYLTAAGMQLQAYEALKQTDPDQAKKAYEMAVELVRQSQTEARRLISEVRPPVIDEAGLGIAISHLVHDQRRRGGLEIDFQSDVQFGRLPANLENALYRIVQEALTNACKHSQGEKAAVTMSHQGQDIRLEVRDWGIGFDAESVGKGHYGLEGIRQRVRLLGGRLTIESAPGSGTLVQVVVPIREENDDD